MKIERKLNKKKQDKIANQLSLKRRLVRKPLIDLDISSNAKGDKI